MNEGFEITTKREEDSVELSVKFPLLDAGLRYIAVQEITKELIRQAVELYMKENFQEIAKRIDPQAIANLVVYEAARTFDKR